MVAGLVIETIQLIRMSKCDHAIWIRINPEEEQCQHCAVIATERGKVHLENLRKKKVK